MSPEERRRGEWDDWLTEAMDDYNDGFEAILSLLAQASKQRPEPISDREPVADQEADPASQEEDKVNEPWTRDHKIQTSAVVLAGLGLVWVVITTWPW